MGLLGRGKKNEAKYRSQSADRYLEENVRDYPADMYGGQPPPPLEGYPPSSAGYAPPYSQSVLGGGYPGNPPVMGTNPRASLPPSQGQVPPNVPLAKGKATKGMAISKYPPWDPRWEKDHQRLLKRHQAEQQKLLKEQQKEAQKQLKIQQEQLKVQEAQMRRVQEHQMRQFQEQQKHLQEEQDKQLKLLQQYADLQQQQQQQQRQSMQAQAGIPGYLDNQPMPVYDYSTLGTLNLDYSTLGTLAYGTYPGTDQTMAAINAAYANAYWTMLYQQNPYLLANYTLPRVQQTAEETKRERGQKRQSRARYRKNRHSKEATLITEDNRRYKSNPDSESSELFISGGSEEDRENADDFKNQLLVQKNKLKKMEETPKEDKEEEGKRRAKSPKNQPIFMAELQKKLKDKQQKNQKPKESPAPPIPPDDIYGMYPYVPGAPVPVPLAPAPPPPIVAPYIAPGAPQLVVPPPTNTEDMEAVKLMNNMDINPPQNITTTEDGPVLPLAQRNETNEDIYDDGKSAIYAVPQKKRNVQPKPPVKEEEDYEEQASGLIIDDVIDDMEAETGVVDINKKQLIKIDVRPDDMVSAVYTADKDGTETIYATNDDILPATGEAAPAEHEEEANMVLNEEEPPPGRGAAELGVWREDHGTTRSPPPSYYTYSPDEEPPTGPYQAQNRRPPANRRYNKKGNRSPQRRPNNRRVIRSNNVNQNPNRYPAQQPRRRNNNCTIQ